LKDFALDVVPKRGHRREEPEPVCCRDSFDVGWLVEKQRDRQEIAQLVTV